MKADNVNSTASSVPQILMVLVFTCALASFATVEQPHAITLAKINTPTPVIQTSNTTPELNEQLAEK